MNAPDTATLSLLEYRMRAVAIGHLALRYVLSWRRTPSIKVLFGGKQVIGGKATAFTNGAIETAIIHARALLEFLGLCGSGQTKLKEIAYTRRRDDSGVEHFAKLSRLTVQDAVRSYPGKAAEAEAALAYVIYLANKGLAHTTSSFTKHDAGSVLLEIALRGVPVLVINNFYTPLGLEPPKYKPVGRARAPSNKSLERTREG
jgi:hypothetical protein